MYKQYQSNKWQKFYEDRSLFKKKFGEQVSDGLIELLDYIEKLPNVMECVVYQGDNAFDIYVKTANNHPLFQNASSTW